MAIGASYKDPNTGYLQVFQYKDTDWVQIGDTIVGQCAKKCTGMHISLSKNGKVLVDGGKKEARIFQFKNNNWYQISEGFDFDGDSWLYKDGIGVSISGDGKVVAMGDSVKQFVKTTNIEALVL
ncbi:hypothetical protein CTEN210_00563 [Chaetoceros tenuissimus]|uniref:Uncharacterized protein n=1 Tax=Chaetoceros tenuissimus TaxID=426638 RepID=A0AAD3GZ89_9STRA|nr:hypothetical protein CTEN210_00563 [Chaetoceros tenuissimus]